jgi:hypothetical protein
MNTASAAMAGWNQGMQQGGPYLGAAYAAIAIAAGAVQLSNINSVGSGGGGGSIGGSGGSGAAPSAPPQPNQGAQQGGQVGQTVNITVNGSIDTNTALAIGRALDKAVREDGLVIGGVNVQAGN